MNNKQLDNKIYLFLNTDYLSVDEYINLQEIAAMENKIKQYHIFFVWNPENGPKVFTSLN